MTTLISPKSLTQSLRPLSKRGTYFVQTWGCQMNEEDSEQIGLLLREMGFEPADSIREAHVIVLNTCSVRKKPEDKAFSLLGELELLKRSRPEIIVGMAGCMAQLRAQEIRRRARCVDFVVGTAQISEIPGLVEQAAQSRRFSLRLDLPERKGAVVTDVPVRKVGRAGKLKAFVPIQYGCDKFCTFCIVPTTRGRERSRSVEEIVDEVAKLAELGTKEVTLLGQTVNSYGKNLGEGKTSFGKLLERLQDVEGLERIRYTSPYPRDFKSDLIRTIRDVPKVMEHVHMPLQSGDDDVLKAMKRLYSVDQFRSIVAELREAVPHIGITTDLIVGFPGETEEQFERTLAAVAEFRFDGAYMFVYSPRPGTPAAEMVQVPVEVKRRRIAQLIELQNRITIERNHEAVGKVMEVLVEGPSPRNRLLLQGYSREFKMMHFEGPAELAGTLVKVRVTEPHLWGLSGVLED